MKTRTIRIERKVERVADSVGEWRGKELIHNTYMIYRTYHIYPGISYIIPKDNNNKLQSIIMSHRETWLSAGTVPGYVV
jgi:hypothetical protein